MKAVLGENIARYRKAQGLTQAALADILGVTFQAVSKWETGQTAPETGLLPPLADALDVSVDRLLGHFGGKVASIPYYDALYQGPEYYWGTQPTELSIKVLQYVPPQSNPKVLDVGCREGQNVLFFARNGYQVTGVDISPSGIEKARRLAEHWHVEARLIQSDAREFVPTEEYDVVFSDEIFHLMRPARCQKMVETFKRCTRNGGVHIINLPVEKPYLPRVSGPTPTYTWKTGELFTLYHDWQVLECGETTPKHLPGNPAPRAYNYIVAKKP